jgi:undecaprenyl pyrophosphate phosphatase UppP
MTITEERTIPTEHASPPDHGSSDGGRGGGDRPASGPAPSADGSAIDGCYRIALKQEYLLTNRTPYMIRVVHDTMPNRHGEIVMPPFAERVVSGARLQPFERQLRKHRQRHELRVRPHTDRRDNSPWLIRAIWLALLAFIVVVLIDLLSAGSLDRTEFYVTSTTAGVVVVGGLVIAAIHERRRRDDERHADRVEGDIAFGVGGAYTSGNETFRRASHLLTFALVVLVGAVAPVAAIIVATDTKTFLSFDGGLHVIQGQESRFVARLIQMTYTAILSLFPALLFFQFDRHRVGTIRSQWVRSIFRMDRRMRTMADLHACYGDELSEASNYSADSVRFLGGKHSPIVVATILIMLGWTLLVIRTESFDFAAATAVSQQVQVADEAAEDAAAAAEQAGQAETDADQSVEETAAQVSEDALQTANEAQVEASEIAETSTAASDEAPSETLPPATDLDPVARAEANAELADAAAEAARTRQTAVQSTSFFQVLTPQPSAAAMAFLGAYFFGVYLVLRSYFRGDLRPKVYNQITARLVTVVVLAYLLTTLLGDRFEDTAIWVLAFVAGVIPTTMVRRILLIAGSVTKTSPVQKLLPDSVERAFSPSRPLTQIDGVDLYDASRMETEGVPDVPALASSDLVSVMVNTRLPVGRLVDWADQSALMVVLSSGNDEELDPRVLALRTRGVRTATDFLDRCSEPDAETQEAVRACLAASRKHVEDATLMTKPAPDDAGSTTPITTGEVCRAIRRQPVWAQVCEWRNSPLALVNQPWIGLPELRLVTDVPPSPC